MTDKDKKIVIKEIDECWKCPHCDRVDNMRYCQLVRRKTRIGLLGRALVPYKGVPDWCPLPEKDKYVRKYRKLHLDVTNATTLTFEEKHRARYLQPEEIAPGYHERRRKEKEK